MKRGVLAQALYDRRTEGGKTQAAAAREVGCDPKTWSKWEDRSILPRDSWWAALARFLGVELSSFEKTYIPEPILHPRRKP